MGTICNLGTWASAALVPSAWRGSKGAVRNGDSSCQARLARSAQSDLVLPLPGAPPPVADAQPGSSPKSTLDCSTWGGSGRWLTCLVPGLRPLLLASAWAGLSWCRLLGTEPGSCHLVVLQSSLGHFFLRLALSCY